MWGRGQTKPSSRQGGVSRPAPAAAKAPAKGCPGPRPATARTPLGRRSRAARQSAPDGRLPLHRCRCGGTCARAAPRRGAGPYLPRPKCPEARRDGRCPGAGGGGSVCEAGGLAGPQGREREAALRPPRRRRRRVRGQRGRRPGHVCSRRRARGSGATCRARAPAAGARGAWGGGRAPGPGGGPGRGAPLPESEGGPPAAVVAFPGEGRAPAGRAGGRWGSAEAGGQHVGAGGESGGAAPLKEAWRAAEQPGGSVAEWSKALDLGSSHFDGVGSNPTAAKLFCPLRRRDGSFSAPDRRGRLGGERGRPETVRPSSAGPGTAPLGRAGRVASHTPYN